MKGAGCPGLSFTQMHDSLCQCIAAGSDQRQKQQKIQMLALLVRAFGLVGKLLMTHACHAACLAVITVWEHGWAYQND